jgi:multidrug resistance efflux pump
MTNPITLKPALLFLGLSVLIVIALRWPPAPSDTRAMASTAPAWVHIEPRLLESRLGLAGRIQAVNQVTLTAPFDGLLAEVRVHEGQRVEKGQVLLTLDPAQLQIQLRQAQAQLLKAQREARRLQHWSEGSEVSNARRVLNNARQSLAASEINRRDTQALFERGIVARMELDTLEQQVRSDRQQLSAAIEELATTLAYGQGEERNIAEMELANAQAHHQALETLHARREMTAPVSGYVVRPVMPGDGQPVAVQPGVAVSRGTPLLGVIGLDRFQALARVDETDLHLLREGMPVQITGDEFAAELSGRILSIGIQNEAAGQQDTGARYKVQVSIDTAVADFEPPLRTGMSARLAVILYRDEQGIAVPPRALRRDESGATYVLHRATAQARPERVMVSPRTTVAQGVVVQGLTPGLVEVPGS